MKRFVLWLVFSVFIWAGCYWGYQLLSNHQNLEQERIVSFICSQVGEDLPESEMAELRRAVKKDQWMAVAASVGGPEGLRGYLKNGPSESTRFLRTGCGFLQQTRNLELSQAAQREMLSVAYVIGDDRSLADYEERLGKLPNSEITYLAQNGAYPYIKDRIKPEYLAIYQQDQELLDELLSVLEHTEWNRFLLAYKSALPRSHEIATKMKAGNADYPTENVIAYIIHAALVRDLTGAGIPEKQSLQFIFANLETSKKASRDNASWAEDVAKLLKFRHSEKGTTAFEAACLHRCFYEVFLSDSVDSFRNFEAVYERFGPTELFETLRTSYKEVPAAIRSISRNVKNRPLMNYIAALLSKYSDDKPFKSLLDSIGPNLCVGISIETGGKLDAAKKITEYLKFIQDNPKNIGKNVNEDGTPATTPLWEFSPGGSVTRLIVEIGKGRSITLSEAIWATLDAATVVIPLGKAVGAVGKAVSAVGRAGRTLPVVATRAGKLARTISAFRTFGWKTIKFTGRMGKHMAKHRYPAMMMVGGQGARMYYLSQPKHIQSNFPEHLRDLAKDAGEGMAKLGPGTLIAMLDAFLRKVWDDLLGTMTSNPLSAIVFGGIIAMVILLAISLPLRVLKVLCPPLYNIIIWPLKQLFRTIIRGMRKKTPALASAGENVATNQVADCKDDTRDEQ